MRRIKALLLICTLSFVAFSCSNDDNVADATPKVDQIVGQWRIDDMLFNGNSMMLNECEKSAVIIFEENHIFDEKAVDFDCTVITENRKGTWEKGEGDLYKIRTHEDSFNAFYNDVEWTTVSIEGDVMTTVCDVDNPFLGTYTLTLKLVKQ